LRIERAIGLEYPGCIANLRELTRLLVEQEGVFRPDPSHPSQSILAWIMAVIYMAVLGHDSLRQTRVSAEPLVRQALGINFDQALLLLDRAGALTSTREAAALRDELMKLIRDSAHQQPKNGNPVLPRVNPTVTEIKTTGQAAMIPGNRMKLAATAFNKHRTGRSSKTPRNLPGPDSIDHPGTLYRGNPGYLIHHPGICPPGISGSFVRQECRLLRERG